jgi:hypothetical protein
MSRLNSGNGCYQLVQTVYLISNTYEATPLTVFIWVRNSVSRPLREEHRLNVFGNKVGRIFDSQEQETIGRWIKLCNKKFRILTIQY